LHLVNEFAFDLAVDTLAFSLLIQPFARIALTALRAVGLHHLLRLLRLHPQAEETHLVQVPLPYLLRDALESQEEVLKFEDWELLERGVCDLSQDHGVHHDLALLIIKRLVKIGLFLDILLQFNCYSRLRMESEYIRIVLSLQQISL
jgi:hypothetical protein